MGHFCQASIIQKSSIRESQSPHLHWWHWVQPVGHRPDGGSGLGGGDGDEGGGDLVERSSFVFMVVVMVMAVMVMKVLVILLR